MVIVMLICSNLLFQYTCCPYSLSHLLTCSSLGAPEVLFIEAIINYKNGEIDKAKAIISRPKSRGVVTQAVMEFENRMLTLDGQEAE